MQDHDFRTAVERATAAAPPPPYVDWGMTLAFYTMQELDARMPGFADAIRARVDAEAARLGASNDADDLAHAPLMKGLSDSWVFNKPPTKD